MIGFQDSIIQVPEIEISSHLPTIITTDDMTTKSHPSIDTFSMTSSPLKASTFMESIQIIMLISVSFIVIIALLFGYMSTETQREDVLSEKDEDDDDDDDDEEEEDDNDNSLDDLLFNENKFAYN